MQPLVNVPHSGTSLASPSVFEAPEVYLGNESISFHIKAEGKVPWIMSCISDCGVASVFVEYIEV